MYFYVYKIYFIPNFYNFLDPNIRTLASASFLFHTEELLNPRGIKFFLKVNAKDIPKYHPNIIPSLPVFTIPIP